MDRNSKSSKHDKYKRPGEPVNLRPTFVEAELNALAHTRFELPSTLKSRQEYPFILTYTHHAERVNALQIADGLTDSLLLIKIQHSNETLTSHRALIDTGALHNSYVSKATAEILAQHGAQAFPSRHKVFSALGHSQETKRKFLVDIVVNNELTGEDETLPIEVQELDIDYDMIVGRPTINKYNLLEKVRNHLMGKGPRKTKKPTRHESLTAGGQTSCGHNKMVAYLSCNQRLANLIRREPSTTYLDVADTTDGIPFKDEDAPWQRAYHDEPMYSGIPEKIHARTAWNIRVTSETGGV